MRPPARLLLAVLAVLAFPAAAASQSTAPPGNAGIDEYVETVPGATGNRRPRADRDRGSTLTPAQRRELEALGDDGRVLAETVEATAPDRARSGDAGAGTASPPPVGGAPASGDSAVQAVVQAASGGSSGGMGALLPIILGATAALAVAVAVARRRTSR